MSHLLANVPAFRLAAALSIAMGGLVIVIAAVRPGMMMDMPMAARSLIVGFGLYGG